VAQKRERCKRSSRKGLITEIPKRQGGGHWVQGTINKVEKEVTRPVKNLRVTGRGFPDKTGRIVIIGGRRPRKGNAEKRGYHIVRSPSGFSKTKTVPRWLHEGSRLLGEARRKKKHIVGKLKPLIDLGPLGKGSWSYEGLNIHSLRMKKRTGISGTFLRKGLGPDSTRS